MLAFLTFSKRGRQYFLPYLKSPDIVNTIDQGISIQKIPGVLNKKGIDHFRPFPEGTQKQMLSKGILGILDARNLA